MKLFSYLNYDDCILMNDLQNKINNHLQNALSVCSENFTSLSCLKKFLQDVNNKQRVNYQLHSERHTIIIKVVMILVFIYSSFILQSVFAQSSLILRLFFV